MMTPRRVFLAATAAVLVAGCGRFPSPTPADPARSKDVVIVSAEGKPMTSTPVGATTRVPATPTFDPGFGSVLTPLAGTPHPEGTRAAVEVLQSPTPELRPTRTTAPTFTPFPTIEMPPAATRTPAAPPPTRTPAPPTNTPIRPTGTPTRTPTPTPVDPFEGGGRTNNDLASATALRLDTDVRGQVSSPTDVDVFKFDVDDDSEKLQIVVTLTGQDIDSYRMFLITPGRRAAAYGTPVGTVARHIVFPVRGELGTWYVELSSQSGRRAPRGGYTLRVTTRSMTQPAPPAE
jgi:hypothetical protein